MIETGPAERGGGQLWVVALGVLLLLLIRSGASEASRPSQAGCGYALGFATLRELVGGQVVGDCLENERFNVGNGNAEQRTRNGLLVWRKADNWTAFTDGHRTWLNGPNGVQQRLNTERFAWESDAPSAAAPAAPAPGAIRGSLNYPSFQIPALRVYAIATTGPAYFVTATAPGEAAFLISGVAPGTYFVLAYRVDYYVTGGWSRFVTCGETAACRDHTLIPVTVASGQAVTGVQVRDWYGDFGIPPPDWRQHWQATTSQCWTGGAPAVACPGE